MTDVFQFSFIYPIRHQSRADATAAPTATSIVAGSGIFAPLPLFAASGGDGGGIGVGDSSSGVQRIQNTFFLTRVRNGIHCCFHFTRLRFSYPVLHKIICDERQLGVG